MAECKSCGAIKCPNCGYMIPSSGPNWIKELREIIFLNKGIPKEVVNTLLKLASRGAEECEWFEPEGGGLSCQ